MEPQQTIQDAKIHIEFHERAQSCFTLTCFYFFWLLEHMIAHQDRVLCKVKVNNGNKNLLFLQISRAFCYIQKTVGEVPKFNFALYCTGVLGREVLLLALNKVQDLFQIMKVWRLTQSRTLKDQMERSFIRRNAFIGMAIDNL